MPDKTEQGSAISYGPQQKSDAEIIQELERMRARIQELETQLRERHESSVTTTASETSSSSKGEDFVNGSAVPVQASGQAQTEPEEKPGKAEPFAFADFTWLNGNARTKTPAFDSKFFSPEIRADVDLHL